MKMVLHRQMKKINRDSKAGFTLIEVIVVIVIIGILASLATPNFIGYIHKLKVREIVRQAKLMDDELSALIAKQYAEIGYMPSVCSNELNVNEIGGRALTLGTGSEKVDPKNYVMLNRVNNGAYPYCSGYGVGNFEYVTLANVQTGRAGNTPSELAKLRQSAGLTEFYRQTGIDLSGSAERVPGQDGANGIFSEIERRWYAIQFYPRQDIASGTTSPYLTTRYLHPDQSYFALYEVKYNGTWYMVMHNWKMQATGSSAWLNGTGNNPDPGKWNVYKNSNPANFQYDNTGGKPFGTVNG